jgi:hypothetical protein
MKIFYFSNERKLIRTLEGVQNPILYGLNEIRWDDGGDTLNDDTVSYLIVEDEISFESITEEEFLRQFKQQAKFELAKRFERNKMYYMVEGKVEAKQTEFEEDKQKIEEKITIEEVKIFMIEVKARTII